MPAEPPRPCGGRLRIHCQPPNHSAGSPWRPRRRGGLDAFRRVLSDSFWRVAPTHAQPHPSLRTQVTSTWCTNRLESPWAVCCQNGGTPRRLTGQAEVCGNVRQSTTPMQVTAIRFVHPVAHTDASCAQRLNCSGETQRCSCANSLLPFGGASPPSDRLISGPRFGEKARRAAGTHGAEPALWPDTGDRTPAKPHANTKTRETTGDPATTTRLTADCR